MKVDQWEKAKEPNPLFSFTCGYLNEQSIVFLWESINKIHISVAALWFKFLSLDANYQALAVSS